MTDETGTTTVVSAVDGESNSVEYEVPDDTSLTVAIVRALAEFDAVDPADVDVLYERFDPEMLERFLASVRPPTDATVELTVDARTVTVAARDPVTVTVTGTNGPSSSSAAQPGDD